MIRRALPAAAIVAGLGLYIVLSGEPAPAPDLQQFNINATYADGVVHIHFEDTTGETGMVLMEIQGMASTLQRTYNDHVFYDTVRFAEPPEYGWEVHPILFDVSHNVLGDIRIKTEIRDAGQPGAPLLFVR